MYFYWHMLQKLLYFSFISIAIIIYFLFSFNLLQYFIHILQPLYLLIWMCSRHRTHNTHCGLLQGLISMRRGVPYLAGLSSGLPWALRVSMVRLVTTHHTLAHLTILTPQHDLTFSPSTHDRPPSLESEASRSAGMRGELPYLPTRAQ